MKILVKLGLLTLKWRRLAETKRIKEDRFRSGVIQPQMTVLEMWQMITRRTDQIYISSEDMLEPYKQKLGELKERFLQANAGARRWPSSVSCVSLSLSIVWIVAQVSRWKCHQAS